MSVEPHMSIEILALTFKPEISISDIAIRQENQSRSKLAREDIDRIDEKTEKLAEIGFTMRYS